MFICRLFRKHRCERAIYLKIFLHWAPPDDPYAVLTQWPILQVIRGHMRSHSFFLPLTFDRTEIERRGWSQCVSLTQTHRLICNMTYLAWHELTWPWPEAKFWHWPFTVKIYIFRCVLTSGTRCCQHFVHSFPSSKVICKKKTFLQKALFLPLLTSLA